MKNNPVFSAIAIVLVVLYSSILSAQTIDSTTSPNYNRLPFRVTLGLDFNFFGTDGFSGLGYGADANLFYHGWKAGARFSRGDRTTSSIWLTLLIDNHSHSYNEYTLGYYWPIGNSTGISFSGGLGFLTVIHRETTRTGYFLFFPTTETKEQIDHYTMFPIACQFNLFANSWVGMDLTLRLALGKTSFFEFGVGLRIGQVYDEPDPEPRL